MTKFRFGWHVRRGLARVAVLAMVAGVSGCGLDKVEIPDLTGPSTFGLSLVIKISPDVLVADAVSTASVRATLLGPTGQPVQGRQVFFQITDSNGTPAAIGQLGPTSDRVPTNRGPEVTEVTGADGIAEVIYRVPERIAFNAVSNIFIVARLVGDDAQGQQTKSVKLELRPAEARTFPDNPSNQAPICSFNVDPLAPPNPNGTYPVGFTIRFQTTASDPDGQVIRYFWDMGDGTQEDGKTLVNHAYSRPGNYLVSHVCTDNNGAQGSFQIVIPVS